MIDGDFRTLVPGKATGWLARLSAPLSLWGGLDLQTGRICDVSHPDCGRLLSGAILAMPGARGSSSSSSALVEAVRLGVAPAAIILSRTDPILVIGGLIAAELYAAELPILLVDEPTFVGLKDGQAMTVAATGRGRPAIS